MLLEIQILISILMRENIYNFIINQLVDDVTTNKLLNDAEQWPVFYNPVTFEYWLDCFICNESKKIIRLNCLLEIKPTSIGNYLNVFIYLLA